LKNIFEATGTRQKQVKKRSLCVIDLTMGRQNSRRSSIHTHWIRQIDRRLLACNHQEAFSL